MSRSISPGSSGVIHPSSHVPRPGGRGRPARGYQPRAGAAVSDDLRPSTEGGWGRYDVASERHASVKDARMRKEQLDGDDVFVIHDFFTPAECAVAIARSEASGFDEAPITTSAGP